MTRMKKPKKPAVTWANEPAIRQNAWLKALDMEQFGYAEIATAVCISHEQATRIVRGWLREGALDEVEPTQKRTRLLWRCKPDFVRIDPLRERTPEENMWTYMRRAVQGFTPTDVAAHATTDTVLVEVDAASRYCRALLDVGYLTVARRAAPAMKREAIYRLVEVTGPMAPVIKRVQAVIDQNTGETRVIGGAA